MSTELYRIVFEDQKDRIEYLSDNHAYSMKNEDEYLKVIEADLKDRAKETFNPPVNVEVFKIDQGWVNFFDATFSNMDDKKVNLYSYKVDTIFGMMNIVDYAKKFSIFTVIQTIVAMTLLPEYQNYIMIAGIIFVLSPLVTQFSMVKYRAAIMKLFEVIGFKNNFDETEFKKLSEKWKRCKSNNNGEINKAIIELYNRNQYL